VKYFDSLRPHHSQVKSDDLKVSGYTFYEYRISLAFDFVQFILSKGSAVEVIEPASLRDAVVEEIKTLNNVV